MTEQEAEDIAYRALLVMHQQAKSELLRRKFITFDSVKMAQENVELMAEAVQILTDKGKPKADAA